MCTVRVTPQTHQRLSELSHSTGRQMQWLIDEAVREYSEKIFWGEFRESYENLAADPKSWEEIHADRAGECRALRDCIE